MGNTDSSKQWNRSRERGKKGSQEEQHHRCERGKQERGFLGQTGALMPCWSNCGLTAQERKLQFRGIAKPTLHSSSQGNEATSLHKEWRGLIRGLAWVLVCMCANMSIHIYITISTVEKCFLQHLDYLKFERAFLSNFFFPHNPTFAYEIIRRHTCRKIMLQKALRNWKKNYKRDTVTSAYHHITPQTCWDSIHLCSTLCFSIFFDYLISP